jgi:zinc finger-like protein
MLDALLAAEELPEEYRDRCQVVQFSSPLFFIVSKIRVFIYLFIYFYCMSCPGYPL